MVSSADIKILRASPRQAGVQRLLDASDAYHQALYPEESNHLFDIDALERSNAAFFTATIGAEIVGIVGLIDCGEYSEIKRMFVDPDKRGFGIGRRLLEHLEADAKQSRVTIIRLETGNRQVEAIRLYKKLCYRERAPYGVYTADPLSIFMERCLQNPL